MTEPRARSPVAKADADALTERFRQALRGLWSQHRPLGLAVSGGPDSLALLLLAQAAIPGQFEVATVDHGLRPDNAAECLMVARVCAERGVPCEILKVTVAKGNVQARARDARYEALLGWADARHILEIATAHHADDQAETLLMRLNRGSGVGGLAGVRERSEMGDRIATIIRPLLGFRRADLAGVVRASGLVPVADPSNSDDRFDRVRIRKALAASDFINVPALADSAANLAQADEAISWCVRREWEEKVISSPHEVCYRGAITPRGWVPEEISMRVVERAIRNFGGQPRRSEIVRLIALLDVRKGGNLAGVLATVEDNTWVFRPEPPRSQPS